MQIAKKPTLRTEFDSDRMLGNAERTTDFLKNLTHTSRLMILCRLLEEPATVGELEEMLSVHQTSVSKQLARLRKDGLVTSQRDGRSIYYSLADERARRVVETLYEVFCD